MDLTPAYLEQARADPPPPRARSRTSRATCGALPVDGPFDAVVCWLNSFGYYDDADCHRVLAEFHRVLRPGGTVAIDTMHHDGGVRHFTPAPDAVVVQRGDDTMVELSTFDPVTGRMVIERTVHRDGAVPARLLLRAAADAARVGGVARGRRASATCASGPGAAGPLELDSWEMVVVATAEPGGLIEPPVQSEATRLAARGHRGTPRSRPMQRP